MDIVTAIKGRACCRAFLDKPVARETVTAVLEAARWAPSGVNAQPWQVCVVSGASKQQLSAKILEAFRAGESANPDYPYYPSDWFEPYKSRRFACGMALYGALDIKREDKQRRQEVWELNYQFFHAPVGLFFLLDKRLERGSLFDYGMFVQNVMLAARQFELETCPQAALAEYPDIVRQQLGLNDNWLVVCGMAMGYPDRDQAINQYRTEREAVDEFTSWFE